jgi:cytochrome subunit of sulfide dehydrogenase
MRTKRFVAAAAIGLAAWSIWLPPAVAQLDANTTRYVAANCANCHGTSGVAEGVMPSLVGQSKERLADTMRAFRDGKRPATVMHQIAKGYTDQQIDAIAEHFARQRAPR